MTGGDERNSGFARGKPGDPGRNAASGMDQIHPLLLDDSPVQPSAHLRHKQVLEFLAQSGVAEQPTAKDRRNLEPSLVQVLLNLGLQRLDIVLRHRAFTHIVRHRLTQQDLPFVVADEPDDSSASLLCLALKLPKVLIRRP